MKRILFSLVGFTSILLSLTLFGSGAFYAVATSYSCALFLLFYLQYPSAFAFLIGLTVALELLGTARFGRASSVSCVLILLYVVFFLTLRFTSTYTRFIVSLFICLTTYSLLLFPLTGLLTRLFHVYILSIPLVLLGYLFTQKEATPRYELL